MNANFSAIVNDLWSLAGWTMVHFLWLGAIVAAFAFAGRIVLRHAAPNARYSFALVCLALITAMPLVAARLSRDNFLASPLASAARPSLPPSTTALPNTPTPIPTTSPTLPIIELHNSTPITTTSPNPPALDPRRSTPPSPQPSTLNPQPTSLLAPLIPYLPWLWLIGTPLTFALLFTGLIGTRRLSRASTPITDGPIADALARLTTSLRITRRVTVAVCERVAAPVLIGIVRPMILLPPAALTGWSPDEIEMVLLHELAHIRRYDNVVNLAQRIVESLLFFHPAVWLISTWVRREREACCDAAVVARTQQPHAYAELLLNIASHLSELNDPSEPGRPHSNSEPNNDSEPGRPRPRPFPLRRGRGRPGSLPVSSPMAAGPLRTRIRHILQLEDDPMLITPKSLAFTLATLLTAATIAFVYLPKIGQAEQPTTEGTKNTEKTDSQKEAAAQDATQKNLKKLIMAVHNNVGNRDSLPANALYDPERRPLLSWRVYILPFLAEEKLYSEFHLGEPWDSEHNRKLIARMPAVYKNPKIDKPGFTNYLAVVGKECVFNGTPNGLRLRDITDGTSKTIAVVEANADLAVEWTKPQDWNFDRAAPTKGLGQLWGDGWYAAWVDGSVRRTENSEPAEKIGIQFTRAGGEIESLKEIANRVPKSAGDSSSGEGGAIEGAPGAGLDWYGKPIGPDSTRDWLGNRIAKNEATTDDWPKGVAFPSPKEGEISASIWQRLRLKLVPATPEELKTAGTPFGIRVRNEFSEQLVPNGKQPIILTKINDVSLTSFNDLLKVHMQLNSSSDHFVTCTLMSDGKTHQLQRERNEAIQPTPRTDSTAKSHSQFPSLEDQKLADLAWKRLGLELEPIAADDLQRVKALGYDGGVKVVDSPPINILPGDILVGLHVWPTTSMKDVATVLNRDDLAEFDPLKFYIIRKLIEQSSTSPPQPRDVVQTGRINVHFAGGSDASRNRRDNGPASTPTPMRNAPTPWPAVQSTQYQGTYDRYNADPSPATPTPPDQNLPPLRSVLINPSAPQSTPPSLATRASQPPPPTLAPRSSPLAPSTASLRYDGKPFEEWRNVWKTELSTEKRLEALKALEAFAAAGLEKEVNSAILDGIYSDSQATAQQIRKRLSRLNETDAAPVVRSLQSTIKTELGSRRRIDALRALAAIGPNAAAALDDLKIVLATKDPQIRIAAATAIKRIVGKDQYQKPVADVLGKELGIEVAKTSSGAWGAVPRDANTNTDAFMKFTEDVIKEQELLFPPEIPPAPPPH